MFDSLKQAASDVQEKAQEAADKAKQVSRLTLGHKMSPTVCLLMICKGFQGISSQPSVVATQDQKHPKSHAIVLHLYINMSEDLCFT